MGTVKQALIALGGNLGTVRATFIQARKQLDKLPDIELLDSSLLYQTSPVGVAGQPDYLNAVIRVQCCLSPNRLLDILLGLERRFGRVRPAPRWSARTLDLDLLDMEGILLDTPKLILPHPRMHERLFVLRPLCDIAPEWIHPRLGLTAQSLHDALLERGEPPITEGMQW